MKEGQDFVEREQGDVHGGGRRYERRTWPTQSSGGTPKGADVQGGAPSRRMGGCFVVQRIHTQKGVMQKPFADHADFDNECIVRETTRSKLRLHHPK